MSEKYVKLVRRFFPKIDIQMKGDIMTINEGRKSLRIDLKFQSYEFSDNGSSKKGAYGSIRELIENLIYNKK
ncbi:MAG: hypothetical protein PHT07_15460 [Paludibacter sp.]|nr:hypothetical protein [Paludibacter sp.]